MCTRLTNFRAVGLRLKTTAVQRLLKVLIAVALLTQHLGGPGLGRIPRPLYYSHRACVTCTQEKAEADLLYALKQCHRKAVGNRRRILKYLVRQWRLVPDACQYMVARDMAPHRQTHPDSNAAMNAVRCVAHADTSLLRPAKVIGTF